MKMGKTLANLCLSAIAAFGIAFAAQAVEIEFEHNPDPDRLINSDQSYSYTFQNLYDPSQWVVGSAEIFIRVYDDASPFSDLFGSTETARFTFDGTSWATQGIGFLNPLFPVNFDLGGLLADGMLTMLLTADTGDYKFDWAKLVLNVTRRVSEPGTLALLGLALMGLGFAARKRAK